MFATGLPVAQWLERPTGAKAFVIPDMAFYYLKHSIEIFGNSKVLVQIVASESCSLETHSFSKLTVKVCIMRCKSGKRHSLAPVQS